MKKILMIIFALMLALTGCGSNEKGGGKGITYDGYDGPDDAVMTINGEPVSVDEFNYFLIMASYDIASANDVINADRTEFWGKINPENGKSYKQTALDDALEKCKPYHIYSTQAKAEGVELTEEDKKKLSENVNQMTNTYGEYMNELQLKAGGLTPDVFEDISEMSQYSVRLYSEFMSNYGVISDEETEKYYNDNYARAKQILVMTVDTETNEQLSSDERQAALKKITEVKSRIDAGDDFGNLVNEYNEDPGHSANPDGYTFTKNDSYTKEFTETAFSLKEGEISGIIESDYGYFIMKREPLIKEKMSAEAVQEKIIADSFQKKLDSLSKDADVRLNEKVYDELDVEKILSDYINSQDKIMAEIQAEYERIYAENGESENGEEK